ncbi:response regulator transcription factor [Methylomonas sp. OY6]|uniref:Response regulator transcription factor n=1 Tax=Methylomonas defluvii TaxID=3045149 RepID=A0ABU4UBH7_9GAMM|nr:response regulator transcription factor [Methylomonas sp. OY6]MDX8126786.1 response regulator transcription factor [Methylomonas sp. OY6]
MHILLVDDHTLFREALLHVLKQLADNVLVYEAANATEAVQLITHTRNLDMVLLDIDLPDMDGLTALPELRALAPTIPVVVLSGSEMSQHVKTALDKGAVGYIPKSCSGHEMLTALRIVLQGDIYIPPRLLGKLGGQSPIDTLDGEILATQTLLTARQIEVLELMGKGLPNKTIARNLNLAEGTVKLHVAAILRALAVGNRTQAVTEAVRRGVLLPPVNGQNL